MDIGDAWVLIGGLGFGTALFVGLGVWLARLHRLRGAAEDVLDVQIRRNARWFGVYVGLAAAIAFLALLLMIHAEDPNSRVFVQLVAWCVAASALLAVSMYGVAMYSSERLMDRWRQERER